MSSAAEKVKGVVGIPVVACGNITPASGEALLQRGAADLIGIGRGLIADPDIVAKLREGRPDLIRPCIRCNQYCVGNAFEGRALGCAVNPVAGHELERVLAPAATPKHVVVVGGGPAGLEAARVAGLRGHRVDVYEATDRIGGVLFPAATPDFKRELRKMIDWWQAELAEIPSVTVHLGHPITADSPELAEADEVVVATGSAPLHPPIPGLDKPIVMEVITAHTGGRPGHRVVVCGGGLSGCDLGLELAEAGHEVTIVEMLDEVARDMLFLNKISLMRSLEARGVTIRTGTRVTEITDKGVRVSSAHGEDEIPCDTVVLAFGVLAADRLARALEQKGIAVHQVGDCVKPRKVGEAINGGFEVALAL